MALLASAGGLNAVSTVLEALPPDLDAAILVLVHLLPAHTSHLPEILARRTSLQVRHAVEGDRPARGTVYVAPPDAHLLLGPDQTLTLDCGPAVRHLRPNGDVLFQSLAEQLDGGRCLAVVLSGTGTDGVAGARAIRAAGGAVVAQDESSAEHFGMPRATIAAGAADHVIALDEIPRAVVEFAGTA